MLDNGEIILAILSTLALGIVGLGGFLVKDVYTKVGEMGALKERVKTLESHVDENKRLPEAVIRLEEQVKTLTNRIEMLAAAILQSGTKNV